MSPFSDLPRENGLFCEVKISHSIHFRSARAETLRLREITTATGERIRRFSDRRQIPGISMVRRAERRSSASARRAIDPFRMLLSDKFGFSNGNNTIQPEIRKSPD